MMKQLPPPPPPHHIQVKKKCALILCSISDISLTWSLLCFPGIIFANFLANYFKMLWKLGQPRFFAIHLDI